MDVVPEAPGRGAARRAELLTIGAFARRSRISPRALRLYERQGLLIPAVVDEDSGYRYYRHSQLDTARLIVLLRRLDMPLRQVAELATAPGDRAAKLLADYWDVVERRNDSQRILARHLQARLNGQQPPELLQQVSARSVEEHTYLVERHHVLVGELSTCIQAAATRMEALADAYSARAGEFTLVYHGDVTEDSDGPVELCLPVDIDAASKAGLAIRVEPAHQQAFVRLRKSQTGYPQVLSAFDAVSDWVNQHGLQAGPPREVYLGHYPDARPDDEICDIAIPILQSPPANSCTGRRRQSEEIA